MIAVMNVNVKTPKDHTNANAHLGRNWTLMKEVAKIVSPDLGALAAYKYAIALLRPRAMLASVALSASVASKERTATRISTSVAATHAPNLTSGLASATTLEAHTSVNVHQATKEISVTTWSMYAQVSRTLAKDASTTPIAPTLASPMATSAHASHQITLVSTAPQMSMPVLSTFQRERSWTHVTMAQLVLMLLLGTHATVHLGSLVSSARLL